MTRGDERDGYRGVGRIFGGSLRAWDRVSDSVSARPHSVLVFFGSVALLLYLQTTSLGSFRAEAVAQAQPLDQPARVSTFVAATFVQPGDQVDVGAPLVELSPYFIDRELAQLDGEIEALLRESRLAQARLLLEEQRWLSPSLRLRPDRPSLEGPTEALYSKRTGLLQTRREQLLEDREGLTILSSHAGRVVRVAPPGSSVAAGSSVASVVAEFADVIVAYVSAQTDLAGIAPGAPVQISRPSLSCRSAGQVLRRGGAVEEAPNQLRSLFRFPVHGMPVYVSVPPDCKLGVGQVLTVEFPRTVM
jgi:hypothetical protein